MTSTSSAPTSSAWRDDRGDGRAGLDEVVGDVRDQVGALGQPDDEQVREAVHVDAVQGLHAVGPVLGQRDAVPADRLEAGPAGVVGADLEARGEDQAVELVVHAADPHAGLVDALDALAVGVDEVGARLVVGLEVLVVEARALAQLAVPGLERLGGLARPATMASTRARISVIFSSSLSSNALQDGLRPELVRRARSSRR